MKTACKRLLSLAIVTTVLLASALQAHAQFPSSIPGTKNTPFDQNTWKNLDPTNKNSSVSKKIDSAQGGRFTVTIRNPTKQALNYSLNGTQQIALLPGYKRTHTGVGNAEIRFDIGRGDGSHQIYGLGSGQTFHFEFRRHSFGGTYLDLFRD